VFQRYATTDAGASIGSQAEYCMLRLLVLKGAGTSFSVGPAGQRAGEGVSHEFAVSRSVTALVNNETPPGPTRFEKNVELPVPPKANGERREENPDALRGLYESAREAITDESRGRAAATCSDGSRARAEAGAGAGCRCGFCAPGTADGGAAKRPRATGSARTLPAVSPRVATDGS